jgi:hypothetical protein
MKRPAPERNDLWLAHFGLLNPSGFENPAICLAVVERDKLGYSDTAVDADAAKHWEMALDHILLERAPSNGINWLH